jgi:HlyD family secretion protein
MRRWMLVMAVFTLLAAGGCAVARIGASETAAPATGLVSRGALDVLVDAPGAVQANQSALLVWRTSGTVQEVLVSAGQRVQAGEVLAQLEQESLPSSLILAEAQRLEARKALDALLDTQARAAQLNKSVEDALQALEDAQNPELAQARAQEAVAQAQKAVEQAESDLEITSSLPSSQAVEQAYATRLLSERALTEVQTQVRRIQARLNRPPSMYFFFESKKLYRKILESLELQLMSRQRTFDKADQRYQALLQPPDPQDVLIAQGNVLKTQAELADAQRQYQRLLAGPTPGQIAVLEAQLEDARRAAARWQQGPDAAEVLAAEARLKAAEAASDLDLLAAPFAGTITQVNIQPGDQVSTGGLAFRLDDLSALVAVVQVSEIDINRIQPGQTAELRFDSAPDRSYSGEVIETAPVGSVLNGVTSFAVKIRLIDADENVRSGMTTEAMIVVERLADVLLVPNQALRFENGQRGVAVQRGSQVVYVPVAVGASSRDVIQVLEGDLQPGEVVLLNPQDP